MDDYKVWRNFVGVIPTSFLKYLPNEETLGNPSSSAIWLTVIRDSTKSFLASPIMAILMSLLADLCVAIRVIAKVFGGDAQLVGIKFQTTMFSEISVDQMEKL